jgi:hypothetical protein
MLHTNVNPTEEHDFFDDTPVHGDDHLQTHEAGNKHPTFKNTPISLSAIISIKLNLSPFDFTNISPTFTQPKKKEDSFNVTSVHSDEKSQPHHVKDGTQEPVSHKEGAAFEQINDNGKAGYIIVPHQYIERIIKVKQANTSLNPPSDNPCIMTIKASQSVGEKDSLTELNQANTNLYFCKGKPGNFLKQSNIFHPQLDVFLLNMENDTQNARSAGVAPSKLKPILPFNTVGIPTSLILTTIKDDSSIRRSARQVDPHMTQHYLRNSNH